MHTNEKWQTYHKNGTPILGEGWDASLNNPEKNNSDVVVGISIVFFFRRIPIQDISDSPYAYNSKKTRELIYEFPEVADNYNIEPIELLWQRRSDKIDRYPGDFDISAGGHINLGESTVEGAIREVKEEIGAEITAEDLNFVTMNPFNKNRFAWIYAVDWTDRPDNFNFNDNEVTAVKWVPYEETKDFIKLCAKEPLKKDKITFKVLDHWFKIHGYI